MNIEKLTLALAKSSLCPYVAPRRARFGKIFNNSLKLLDEIASWAVLGLVVGSVELAFLLWDSCSTFCATSQRDKLLLPSLIGFLPPINISSMNNIS